MEPFSSAKQVEGRRNTSVRFSRINVVRLTVVLPEGGRFGVERIDSHRVLQFGKRRDHFVLFGNEATAKVSGRYSR